LATPAISLAVGLAVIHASPAFAQTAPRGSGLTVYSSTDLKGQKRVMSTPTVNLAGMGADNFSWRLNAVGRRLVCIEANLRAGCRVVDDQIADLGTRGDAILLAQMLHATNAAVSPIVLAATQTAAPGGEAALAYVYATVGFGKIKPELVIDGLGATVTGTYTATQSESQLNEIYSGGIYGITSGTLDGTLSGSTLSGYWYETEFNAGLQIACREKRNGTFIYGRFTLKFSADRKSFTGLRTSCDEVPNEIDHKYETWNGTLVRRQAAAASSAPAGHESAAAPPATRSSTTPSRQIVSRAAENEINIKDEETARLSMRAISDKVF